MLEVCEACGEEFSPGEEKILYQCKSFHHNCFTCNECKKPLGTQEFVKRDGKHFCKECADALDAKVGKYDISVAREAFFSSILDVGDCHLSS